MSEKLKQLIVSDQVYIAMLVLLVGVIAFGLGRIHGAVESPGVAPSDDQTATVQLISEPGRTDDRLTVPPSPTALVASRNGTRFYYQHCSGVNRISAENRIYFPDEFRARAAGYTPAVGCNE